MSYLTADKLKNNAVMDTCCMETAISYLNNSNVPFLIVFDENNKVVGTVTDGDIRRGLIKGLSLNDLVSKFMTEHFVYGLINEADHHYKMSKISSRLPFLPILDLDGHLISVYGNFDIAHNIKSAVVMAGGYGKRLGPLTYDKPKPLVEVNGKKLLEHVLEKLEDALVEEIFILTIVDQLSVNKRQSRASTKRFIYSPLGTAGGLFNLPVNKPEKFLIMNCDITNNFRLEHLFRYFTENECDILVAVTEFVNQLPFGVVSFDKRYNFKGIKEKPIQKYYVSSGVNIISSDVLGLISKDEAIDMPELINRAYARGHTVNMFPIHEPWIDLGRQEDIENFEGGL